MGKMVQFAVKEYKTHQKNLKKMRKTSETVNKRIVSDFRTRAPSWIAAEVSKVYGIGKKDVNTVGKMKVQGDSVSSVEVVYRGRVLTPTHFKMSPTTPKPAYTLKAEIIKGEKKTLGKVKKPTKKQRKEMAKNFTHSGERKSQRSPIMLMSTGGTNYIPFQRTSVNRNDIHAVKTISVPQMVSNEKVHTNITNAINTGMEKRIAHHMKLLQK